MSRAGLLAALERDLWSAQARQQLLRFGRLFVSALVLQVAALGGGHLGRSALVGAGVGALEVAFRQWVPVMPWTAVAARVVASEAGPKLVPPPDAPASPPSAG